MKTLARESDKAEILRRLKEVRPESVRRWGRMSPHQMVCHLNDSFLVVMGEMPVSHASGLFQRTLMKWIALYLPLPWPAGILTRPEIDQELGGTRPGAFAADVVQLESLVELITTRPRGFDWQSHPIFGKMSDTAWMRWAYLHMDHHLRQFGVQLRGLFTSFDNFGRAPDDAEGVTLLSDFVGGKVMFPRGGVTPYAQAGLGGAYFSAGSGGATAFATRFGGGVTVPIKDSLAWRVEYSRMNFRLRTSLDSPWTSGNNLSVGLVFALSN